MAEEVEREIKELHKMYLARVPFSQYKHALIMLNEAETSGDGERIADALFVAEEFRVVRTKK